MNATMNAGVGAVALAVGVALISPPTAKAGTVTPPVEGVTDGAPPPVFALIVGVNSSVDRQTPPLRYADDDAVRYDALFRAVGAHTRLLTRLDENTRRISPDARERARPPRRAELERAVEELADEGAVARARGQRPVLFFVYAGHGNVDGSGAYLALEDARLTGPEIERAVIDHVHAESTHLIIDACYSYFLAYGRGPGGSRREVHGFAPVEGLARRDDVGLLLSTTVARESHEWEGFQAGVFSHEVRSGLYGAADFDGDGRVSYRELAAFVSRANAAIPNERFRPEVFARPPRNSVMLLDLRGGVSRHLRVDATAAADHYVLEDGRGVRLADFHNTRGHPLSVILAPSDVPLYLRRATDGREVTIPLEAPVVNLTELSPEEPRFAVRGAAHDAFSLVFALPFDDDALASYASPLNMTEDVDQAAPLPRWRRRAAVSASVLCGVSAGAALLLAVSAHALADEAHAASTQAETAALDDRLSTRKTWADIAGGVAASSAIAAGLLWLWPTSTVRPAASLGVDAALVGLGGRF
ncbi:MAG TPA: caspase family protein [Polyangia bacterium]